MEKMSNDAKTNHEKKGTSTLAEDEIARLMQTYGVNRQQAENIMKRKSTAHIRRRPVEAITQEEMDSLLEEITRSGQNMSLFGKKKSADEEQQEDT